jgi:acetoin:2,6-dichlorophenolindophenol oxidoreductase subunit beta
MKISYAQAINKALEEEMKRNKKLVCFGLGVNDSLNFFGTTKGLKEKFGNDRVFETPTSENAMTGIGIGMSLYKNPCVMMHQRLDFFLLAMDQLVNSAAKWHYMFGGINSVPITIRLIVGKGWGQGPTHSQSLQSWFAHIPGLKVVMPSLPSDAYNLLKASIRDPNPVIFIEHRWLHGVEENKIIKKNIKRQIGTSNILSKGNDFTVVTYSLSTLEILALKKDLNNNNIFFDHIDLQTIKPLDLKKIKNSLRKTKKLLVLDTISHPICSIGSEIISQIYLDKKIKLLKTPILLTLPDIPSPTSSFYTKNFYISKQDIINKIKILTNKKINIKLSDNIAHDVPDKNFKGPF